MGKSLAWLIPLLAWPAIGGAMPAEALIQGKDGAGIRVWITAVDAEAIRYTTTPRSADKKEIAMAGVQSVHLFTPLEMTEALVLFHARNYDEAKVKFAAVKEGFKDLAGMPANPSSAAGFLELECLRKSGNLEGLAKAFESFDRRGLLQENQLRQLDLYAMWETLRVKDWPKTEEVAKAHLTERLPGYQRAQAEYCHGAALEGQGKDSAAIDAYQRAMTADAGASEGIARDAALRALRIYRKDAEVIAAMTAGAGPGKRKLLEAAGLAEIYEFSLGSGVPLPAELREFLKFRPEAAAR